MIVFQEQCAPSMKTYGEVTAAHPFVALHRLKWGLYCVAKCHDAPKPLFLKNSSFRIKCE